jgi:DNA-binding NtrC family response regulator
LETRVQNLRDLLRFSPDSGHIWLGQHRMLLLHTRAMGALRKELFDTLGVERARGLLIRMGFVSGQRDGEMARAIKSDAPIEEMFKIGPQLHGLEGVTRVDTVRLEIDLERRHFYGEFLWENSWEDDVHIADFGIADSPACWTQLGYASGYTSSFLNQLIVYKEVECRSMGDCRCRIVGQPAEAWDDPAYLNYFKADSVVEQLLSLQTEVAELRSLTRAKSAGDLVGQSTAFHHAFQLLQSASQSQITVLLLGETGVGKEMFARWLHENSSRAGKPFVAINCGAIPENLIESELFGVEKGAYTGAQQSRAGRFERAHGGTLFLDEIGDLPLAAQVKLLRVLQSGEVERLGADGSTRVDIRLIAATNVELQQAVKDGRFRADLYYRLSTFPIVIPALRDRRADIPLLIERFLEKYSAVYQKKLRGLSDRALKAVNAYPWPGNIRELENLIERGVLLAPNQGWIEEQHLFAVLPGQALPTQEESTLDPSGHLVESGGQDLLEQTCDRILDSRLNLDELERALLQAAVRKAGGNLSHAARLLGITRPQLSYRLKKDSPRDEQGGG